MKKSFINHVESYIGEIEKGWVLPGHDDTLQVVKIMPKDIADTSCYLTLGVSDNRYRLSNSDRSSRFEFLLLVPKEHEVTYAPSILDDVIIAMKNKGEAFLRGDIIGPKGILFNNTDKTALYVAPPMCLDENLNGFTIEGDEVVFVWLVPISTQECEFIARMGWESFEDALEENEVDVLDFDRPSLLKVEGEP